MSVLAIIEFAIKSLAYYVAITHPVSGAVAPFVSHNNHLKPWIAMTLGFALGPPGVWWVMKLNAKAERAIRVQNARIAAAHSRGEHPMFKHGGALPTEESPAQPTAGPMHSPQAFRLPSAGWKERPQSKGEMPSVKPDDLNKPGA